MMKDGHEFRVIEENCWSPEARLADMDRTGDASYSTTIVFDYTGNVFESSQFSPDLKN